MRALTARRPRPMRTFVVKVGGTVMRYGSTRGERTDRGL